MHKIKDLKAGDFIDLENWFKEINDEVYDNLEKFYLLLWGYVPKSEEETLEAIKYFESQKVEIIENYDWIYNPPQMPTSSEDKEPTIGDEYRKEFAEYYGSYVEIIFRICSSLNYKPDEVLQMKCEDYLFWGNYLLGKRFCENIK